MNSAFRVKAKAKKRTIKKTPTKKTKKSTKSPSHQTFEREKTNHTSTSSKKVYNPYNYDQQGGIDVCEFLAREYDQKVSLNTKPYANHVRKASRSSYAYTQTKAVCNYIITTIIIIIIAVFIISFLYIFYHHDIILPLCIHIKPPPTLITYSHTLPI